MFGYFRRRRLIDAWARETAKTLVATHGIHARGFLIEKLVESTRAKRDTTLEAKVKREVDRLLGIKPRADTATRYLEDHR